MKGKKWQKTKGKKYEKKERKWGKKKQMVEEKTILSVNLYYIENKSNKGKKIRKRGMKKKTGMKDKKNEWARRRRRYEILLEMSGNKAGIKWRTRWKREGEETKRS